MKLKNIFTAIALLLITQVLLAQIPTGYYNSTNGLIGVQLKLALHNIIDNHTSVDAYDNFHLTDSRLDNGKVWDIYSDNPDGSEAYYFTFGEDKCGNYNSEGDCYNREHSWPQSWVNDQSVPCADMHMLYPTDGWVNGKRSNLPYGETSNPTYTSTNGSKKGSNTTQGYNGTIFEPIDEYKGDLARAYFYVSVRYYNEDSGWTSNDMVNKSVLKEWAYNMLYSWHINDPVSEKEIDRNNAVHNLQHNRNPFIDHPIFVDAIWDPNYQTINTLLINKLRLFPNPAKESITISLQETEQIKSVKIYNTIGSCIANFSKMPSNGTIYCKDYKKGVYFVEVIGSKGSYFARFIKE